MDLHSLLLQGRDKVRGLYQSANRAASTKLGKFAIIGITVSVSISVLGYLLYSQRKVLQYYDWNLNFGYLAPFILLYVINLILVTYVWGDILKIFKVHAPFGQHFKSYVFANLAKRIPGTIWYIPVRKQIYGPETGLTQKLVTLTSAIELLLLTISSLFSAVLFSLTGILTNNSNFLWFLVAILLLTSILLIPSVRQKIFRYFNQSEIRIPSVVFGKWIVIYLVTRILGGSMLFCVVRLLSNTYFTHLPSVIGFHSFVALLSLIMFILPTNLGFSEVGISLLLSTIMPSSIAVLIALANRILVICMDIISGVIFATKTLKSFNINHKGLLK